MRTVEPRGPTRVAGPNGKVDPSVRLFRLYVRQLRPLCAGRLAGDVGLLASPWQAALATLAGSLDLTQPPPPWLQAGLQPGLGGGGILPGQGCKHIISIIRSGAAEDRRPNQSTLAAGGSATGPRRWGRTTGARPAARRWKRSCSSCSRRKPRCARWPSPQSGTPSPEVLDDVRV